MFIRNGYGKSILSFYFRFRTYYKDSERKGSHVLNKLLEKKVRKRNFENKSSDTFQNAFVTHNFKSFGPQSARMVVLNKVFLEHISQIWNSGPYVSELEQLGVEITRVNISKNYNELYVFWASEDTAAETKIEYFLSRTAGVLRSMLSSLNVIGHVPVVIFARDKEYIQRKLMENVFLSLDKVKDELMEQGKDFDYQNSNKVECEGQIIDTHENAVNIEETKIPEMAHNLLGLDRQLILDDIIKAKKAKENTQWPRANAVAEDDIISSSNFNKKELSKILLEKRHKMKKMMKEDMKGIEYYFEDKYESSDSAYDEDYIYDDYDDENEKEEK